MPMCLLPPPPRIIPEPAVPKGQCRNGCSHAPSILNGYCVRCLLNSTERTAITPMGSSTYM